MTEPEEQAFSEDDFAMLLMAPAVPVAPVAPAPAPTPTPAPAPEESPATTAPAELPADEQAPGARPPAGDRWRAAGIVALIVVALVIVFMAFHSSAKPTANATGHRRLTSTTVGSQATVTSAPSTTVTTAAATPPSSPQPNPDGAATILVSSWASGNQAKALTVATPQAVASLFGAHYQSGLAGDRGCSVGGPPVTCSFGPPGGASPTDPLYSLTVSQAPGGGWYVSAVQILG